MAAVSSIVMAVATVAAAGHSIYSAEKQSSQAKKAQKKQDALLAEQAEQAETERAGLLESQRSQMGLDGNYSTTSTTVKGLTAGTNSTLGG